MYRGSHRGRGAARFLGVRRGVVRLAGGAAAWRVGWGHLAQDEQLVGTDLVGGPDSPFALHNVAVGGVAVLAVAPAAVTAARAHPIKPAATSPPVGAGLAVVASPYALLCPTVLTNLRSTGVVSAHVVARPGDRDGPAIEGDGATLRGPLLLLTDCRCQPGAEGALVLTAAGDAAVGMVLLPLRCGCALGGRTRTRQLRMRVHARTWMGRHRELAVELNLVVPMARLLAAVGRYSVPAPVPVHVRGLRPVATAAGSVVLVSIAGTWASGVVVSDRGRTCRAATLRVPPVVGADRSVRCHVTARDRRLDQCARAQELCSDRGGRAVAHYARSARAPAVVRVRPGPSRTLGPCAAVRGGQ
jgi:hypothetical protein